MKYLNDEYYVEVKDHRYDFRPAENKILRKRNLPISLRTQYQVQNDTQIKENQEDIKNDNDELIIRNYPKNKQPLIQQPKLKPPDCSSCKRNNWLEFNQGWY